MSALSVGKIGLCHVVGMLKNCVLKASNGIFAIRSSVANLRGMLKAIIMVFLKPVSDHLLALEPLIPSVSRDTADFRNGGMYVETPKESTISCLVAHKACPLVLLHYVHPLVTIH